MKESNSTDGNYQFRDYTPFVKAAILTNLSMRPFIYLGSGVSNLNIFDEVIAFAEKISAPIGASFQKSIKNNVKHSLYFGHTGINGMFEANKALAESDLIIAIGSSSCADIQCSFEFIKNKKIICITELENKIQNDTKISLNLNGDIKQIITLLTSITLGHYNSNNFWIRDIKNSARVISSSNNDVFELPETVAFAK
ncbi:MAG: hypothetical protein GYA50_10820 [Eubacteriaceae bacterium]|nr:hypothetical protein [Eubacteriaceae bacterium]